MPDQGMKKGGHSARLVLRSTARGFILLPAAFRTPLGPSLGPHSHQPINLPRLTPDMLAPLLHLHESKIQDVHRAVGAEFDVDGALQADFAVVAAGRAFSSVADEILDGAIV